MSDIFCVAVCCFHVIILLRVFFFFHVVSIWLTIIFALVARHDPKHHDDNVQLTSLHHIDIEPDIRSSTISTTISTGGVSILVSPMSQTTCIHDKEKEKIGEDIKTTQEDISIEQEMDGEKC